MRITVGKTSRVVLALRLFAYACGFAGMAMMLAARGMTEPGRSVWGQRAFLFLTLMFISFVACYLLAFLRNLMERK